MNTVSNNSTIIESAIAKLVEDIAFLRQLVKLEIQHSWQDLDRNRIVPLNELGYFVFPQGKEVRWLGQQIRIPTTVRGYPIRGLSLRLVLTWWADDAQIFIDDELVQQGDLFDSSARVLITDNVQLGTEYFVKIRLVSPNHDIGALMRSHLIYEKSDPQTDPGFVADEITVLYKYLTQFKPEQLGTLAAALQQFDRHSLQDFDFFERNLAQLRSSLLPLARNIKQRRFNLLGHAHLDMAWLWTTDETYEVAERTFRSVLNLQQDFPNLTFGHTTPALYQWIEHHRPELFTTIKQAVEANKWEILGGMWIEPETNLVSGESLIRQSIYGQQYYQDSFGQMASVAWLPDSFGFTWQLPQIMQQCGIKYFVTGKLHWNDTTEFPHGCFWWESPDGTRLLTLMSPPNVTGVMDTNPITMVNYGIDWEVQTGLQEIFWLPGVGDHGGGPTRDMLEVAAKWDSSPFFPRIEFVTAGDYLERIEECFARSRKDAKKEREGLFVQQEDLNKDRISDEQSGQTWRKTQMNAYATYNIEEVNGVEENEEFPIWRNELYLELHRGCYTVHADQKLYNRRCERLLYEAELWSSLAMLCSEDFALQPLLPSMKILSQKEDFSAVTCQQLIELAWKKVLFNQFHDILPGTSIREVFTEANRDWQSAIAIGKSLLDHALDTIAASIQLPTAPRANAVPVVVFNSLNWKRSQVVTIENEKLRNLNVVWRIYSDTEVEISNCYQQGNRLTFQAKDVPGVGYRLFWLCPEAAIDTDKNIKVDGDYELTNRYLKIVVNPNTGNLDSIYDLVNYREILAGVGNELQAFEDKGQYWDAWNIDPEYEQKRLPDTRLEAIEWLDTGLSRGIRVIKTFNRSRFIQDYILEPDSSILNIVNQVDWQETHVMVKAAFPLTLNSDRVTYEIPCGAIERATKPEAAADKAKWEVPALNWADLTDTKENYGVSLLNDCKYGYDARSNCLRLTLLRAATWPDPQSDRGMHRFTYSIYLHPGSWHSANTVQKGYELNTPLRTIIIDRSEKNTPSQLPPTCELLNLSADNLILMALQGGDRDLIMRCYEASGIETQFQIRSDLNLKLHGKVDCLGREQLDKSLNSAPPYKIISLKLRKESTDRHR